MMKSLMRRAIVPLFLLLMAAGTASAFDFSDIESRVVEFRLNNGLKVLVLPREEAPVASFVTMVNVGGADDPKGSTGIAHLFEHMAFKGTKEIGTSNLSNELKWMAEEDRIFKQIFEEKAKGAAADTARLAKLEEELQKASDSAGQYVVPNEYGQIVEREGGVGLNAFTSYDVTAYHMSFPANRLELWMAMEADRFTNPVLREVYKEKHVIAEERRMRTESSPQGKLVEEFISAAYKAHPYHNSLVGHMSDIMNYNRMDALQFFKKYYVPSNMVVVIVGDVRPENVRQLAEKYLGKIPAGPKPAPILTEEPPQISERRITVRDKAQPVYLCGFPIPHSTHPDMPALEALADYLGQGRTSQLYKSLVKEKKLAIQAVAFAGFPGVKYPSLFGIYAMPAKDKTNAENEQEILAIIEKVKNELIPAEEVEKIKARAKANLINSMTGNEDLAMALATYEVVNGGWRKLFNAMEKVESLTPEDIKRVANQYLDANRRTVGMLEPEESN
jgi:predicted Zn-dependent peptidase